ncbi:replication initiation protein [Campylobacter upsaliensis]|nr:replication initiation protein [Campylobacter upsaliensis]
MKGHIMACKKLVTFDFVDGSYIVKMSKQSQTKNVVFNNSKIVYRNEMNSIRFPNFSAMDFNLFFTICYFGIKQNKNKRALKKSVKIKFDDLRIFMPQIKNKKRFFDEIAKFVKYKLNLIGVNVFEYDEVLEENGVLRKIDNGKRKLKGAVFIKKYVLDEENEELYLEFTSYAYSLLNEFGNFMSFDMNEFCSFENKYTKTLFRLLKQYENSNTHTDEANPNIKAITMTKDEFKKFMNTPDNYETKDLERKVIKPSIKEIKSKTSYFNGSTHKSYSIQMIDYEKIFEEYEKKDNVIQRKRQNVKGFKFIFEKKI